MYIGAFDGLNTGDSPAEQSILYLGAEPLAFVPPRKACAIITDHLFRVCGTVLALVAGMRVPPALHLDISAAEIVRVALKPGGLGLALLLFAAAGFAAGFLGFDGTDVRNILAAAIRAAFRGGTFYGDLLHETLSKRVYIEMYWKGMANWGICAADLYTICRQELYTLKLPLTSISTYVALDYLTDEEVAELDSFPVDTSTKFSDVKFNDGTNAEEFLLQHDPDFLKKYPSGKKAGE